MSTFGILHGIAFPMRSFRVVACILLLVISGYSRASCSGQSSEPLHLVELFTSSGCSSCPPAEKWMNSLRDSRQFAGLEFHVDYFDTPAWRDPFGSHAFTLLQEGLAKVTTHGFYATPQIWVDGQPWKDWPKPDPPKLLTNTSSVLSVQVISRSPLRATFKLLDPTGHDGTLYDLYAAVTEDDLSSTITGGENKGRKLPYDNVVRAFSGPLPAADADVAFKLPQDVDLAHSTVVGFLQNRRNGLVSGVVRVPLVTCRTE